MSDLKLQASRAGPRVMTILKAIFFALPPVWLYRKERDGDWHRTFDNRMRRFVLGKWEYRDMTPEEEEDHISHDAW